MLLPHFELLCMLCTRARWFCYCIELLDLADTHTNSQTKTEIEKRNLRSLTAKSLTVPYFVFNYRRYSFFIR